MVSPRLISLGRQCLGSRTAGDVRGVCGGGGRRKDVIWRAKGELLL